MANRVSIELGANDTASPVVEKVRATTERNLQQIRRSGVVLDQYGRAVDSTSRAMESQAGAARNSAGQANQLEKEFAKLTSGTEFAAQGVQQLRGVLSTLVWSSLIAAVIAVVSRLIEYALAARNSAVDTEQLNKTVLDGSVKYGLLAQSQRDVTETTVRLFNAELELAQFRAVRDRDSIQQKIEALQEENRVKEAARRRNAELLESMEANHPLYLSTVTAFTRQSETILENNLEIAKLTNREADLKKIMDLKKTSLDQVAVATDNLTEAQRIQTLEWQGFMADAVRAENDRRAAQEQLGRSILAAAQAQAAEKAATQEAMGRSIQMAAVLDQQRLAEERLLQVEKFRSTTEVNPFAAQEEETRRLAAAYNDLALALSGVGAENHLLIMTMGLGLDLISATSSGIQSWLTTSQKIGPAMKAAAAQAIAAYAAEAAILAIMSTARGLLLLSNPATQSLAPAAFAAAAQYALVATVAGTVARQFANSAGMRSGSGGAGATTPLGEEAPQQGGAPTYNITIVAQSLDPRAVQSRDFWDPIVRDQLAPAIGEHIEGGGRFGNINIAHERR